MMESPIEKIKKSEENNRILDLSRVFIDSGSENQEKKISFLDALNKISPGKNLRSALDEIIAMKAGALIVVDCPSLKELISGGFRINTKFTPQKLAELCKMDGAVILSEDLKKIIYANVLLVPDKDITTEETGTRHKAAERTAKQTGTIVIAVSEEKNKISLYYRGKKHILENSDLLLRKVSENLMILERQKELLEELLKNFNILEITNLVTIRDICTLIQKLEVIRKMLETMKRDLIELGNKGTLFKLMIKELSRGIVETEQSLLEDYIKDNLRALELLEGVSFEGIMDLEALAGLLFKSSLEKTITPKGYRLLSKINITPEERNSIVESFDNLFNIFEKIKEVDSILKNKGEWFRKEIEVLKEKIFAGRKI
jgi:diadenylate cyclase